jgi:hypothetical protein
MSQPVTSSGNPRLDDVPLFAGNSSPEMDLELKVVQEMEPHFSILDRLGERLRYEMLLAGLSADFIHLPPDKIDFPMICLPRRRPKGSIAALPGCVLI